MFQDQMMTFHGMPPQFHPPDVGFVFQGPHEDVTDLQQQPPPAVHALHLPVANAQDFRGHLLGAALQAAKRPLAFPPGMEACEDPIMEDELSDDGSQPGDRKKRLNVEQVRMLERNFEMGNKLEPERKLQLARALGLQPRQIAIWFQNKRARWKTKQLERDFDALKRQFDAMKAENDILQAQNRRLQTEVLALKGIEICEAINLNKEIEGSCSNRSENSSDIKLDIQIAPKADETINPHTQGRAFFPSYRPTATSKLVDGSSMKPEAPQCATAQIELAVQQDENFSDVLCSTDDQPAFWAWPEQHNFH